jgi:hypothetical protein
VKDSSEIQPSRDLIDRLKRKDQKAPHVERRTETRIIYKSPVKIKNVKTGVFNNARMVNYSDNGIYLETNSVLRAGTIIYLGIANSPYIAVSDIYDIYQANILWRKELKSAFYHYGYGVRLILVSDNHHSPSSVFNELRKYRRKPYTKSVCFTSKNQRHQGLIKNVSPNGVFIETRDPLSVGQKIELVIPGKRTGSDRILIGRVMRVSPTGVGVRFKASIENNGSN